MSATDCSVFQDTVDFVLYISKGIKHSSKTNKQVFVNNPMLKQLFTRTQMSQIAPVPWHIEIY